MKIALTGATGLIGSHLACDLVERGHEVTALVRTTSDLSPIADPRIRKVTGSLEDRESLAPLVRNQDIIIHTAGTKFARDLSGFLAGNLGHTKNLYRAIEAAGNGPPGPRVIYISSIAALGPASSPAGLTEADHPHPITPYGLSKHLTEQFVRSRAPGIPYTIVRPPGVYGPRDRDILIYFRMVSHGIRLMLARDALFDFIYVKNLVHGIRLAVESREAVNQLYHFADPFPYTWHQFTGYIARAMHVRALAVRVPVPLASLAAGALDVVTRVAHLPLKFDRNKLVELSQTYWLASDRKARAQLGYRAIHPPKRAFRETVEWYREAGWL